MNSPQAPGTQQRIDAPVLARGRVARGLYATLGTFFVALGVAGIALPLLPSTPFFLLAAGCFGRSSPRAYRWLMTNRLFGAQLRAYREQRGATVRSKVIAITTIWTGISISIIVFELPILAIAILIVIAASISVYLIRLRNISAGSRVLAPDSSSWG